MKFYKTNDGKIVIAPKEVEGLIELVGNTTEAAHEKHIPVVKVESDHILVNVGSVDHPMIDVHYIEFIAIEDENGFHLVNLKPGEAPKAIFPLAKHGVAYAYCNLHGLWKAEF